MNDKFTSSSFENKSRVGRKHIKIGLECSTAHPHIRLLQFLRSSIHYTLPKYQTARKEETRSEKCPRQFTTANQLLTMAQPFTVSLAIWIAALLPAPPILYR